MTDAPIRLFVAAHSPTDHDALCQFLRGQGNLDVICEVRHASAFLKALGSCRADLLILNRRLPGSAPPDDLLRQALEAMPPRCVIYILPAQPQLAPKVGWLRRKGVTTLVGAFGAESLLESIHRAYRPPRTLHFCAVRSGLGVSTLCASLACLSSVDGERVHLYDAAPRGDLLALTHLPSGMEAVRAGPPGEPWGLSIVDWGTAEPQAGEDIFLLLDQSPAAQRAYAQRAKTLADHRTIFSPVGTPIPSVPGLSMPWLARPPFIGKAPKWNRTNVAPFAALAADLKLTQGGLPRERFPAPSLRTLLQRGGPGRGPR